MRLGPKRSPQPGLLRGQCGPNSRRFPSVRHDNESMSSTAGWSEFFQQRADAGVARRDVGAGPGCWEFTARRFVEADRWAALSMS